MTQTHNNRPRRRGGVTRPLTARRPARVLPAAPRSAPKTTKHYAHSPI